MKQCRLYIYPICLLLGFIGTAQFGGGNPIDEVPIWYEDYDKDSWGNPNKTIESYNRPNGYVNRAGDCNDRNETIFPKNYYRDGDKDGYGRGNPTILCSPGVGYATRGGDCNDGNAEIHPNTRWYADSDGDGFGNGSDVYRGCTRPNTFPIRILKGGDCNDDNPAIHPNTVWYYDNDGDGFASSTKVQCSSPGNKWTYLSKPVTDCNDNNKLIHPNTVWYKNSDGDGFASTTKKQCTNPGAGYSLTVKPLGDCNDGNKLIHPNTVWYKNSDGDGFASTTKKQCTNPGAGYSLTVKPLGDCNDGNKLIHPNTVWYKNSDGDGFASTTKKQCTNPGAGYSLTVKPLGDCNDDNKLIHPNTVWYKNSDGDGFASTTKKQCTNPGAGYSLTVKPLGDLDDNNGLITNIPPKNFYRDVDKDTFGDPSTKTYRSVAPSDGYTYVTNGNDYDDSTANINNITPQTFYLDSDGDGFGDPNQSVLYSIQPTGYVTNGNDRCPDEQGENQGCADILYTSAALSDQNYVFTRVYQEERSSATAIVHQKDVIENVTYFDGLGRPMQQTAIAASPTAKDIVTHIAYDALGRQTKQYLPFERQTSTTSPLGSYTSVDVISDINTYYKSVYDTDFTGISTAEVNAYSESTYEASPLNRIKEQGAPGKDWKIDPNSNTDHTIKFDRKTNIAPMTYFKVVFTGGNTQSPTLVKSTSVYAIGELYVTITKDENWTAADGNNHTTREYTDKRGRVVLKRTYNTTPNTSGGSSAAGGGEAHDTYYVYDQFDNLTYVIPPKVTTADGVSTTEMNELCYQYKYDYRNRPFAKKLPGKDWEYTIYNKLDQPIMTHDPNLRTNDEWLFIKYNSIGKISYTGKIIDSRDRKVIQDEANTYVGKLWVERGNATIIGGVTMYYTDDGYPKATTAEVLTINYYDDYNFDLAGFTNPNTVYGEVVTDRTKSLVTGAKIKILDTSNWTTTVNYYDKKARPIYVASKNEYLNTIDIVENKLDFVGKPLETKTTHIKDSNTPIITIDTFEYDHMGRVLKQIQSTGNQKETIVENNYDELGKFQSKTMGGGLQTIDYTYSVRGWIKGINNVENLGNDLFALQINYTNPTENLGANPLYNGNISEIIWETANDNMRQAYGYTYNALNYITQAKSKNGNYDVSNITYDKNGNILSLTRKGITNELGTSFGVIDNLTYTYDSGNKLLNVDDSIPQPFGFKKMNNTTGNDYSYDDNGNMIIDKNKGVTAITYNHLNLPVNVSINSTESNGAIEYTYDALGTKLRKTVVENGTTIITDYAGGYTYKKGKLEYFNTGAGYAEPQSNGSYLYVYQIKDHLGNIRLNYADSDNDGKIDVIRNGTDIDGDNDNNHEIREIKDYYPFGLLIQYGSGHPNSLITGRKHNYGFGGKEEQGELKLDWLDFSARNYNPSIARWMNIDPLAEEMYRNSPYSYAFNNPVLFLDPDGKKPFPGPFTGSGYRQSNGVITVMRVTATQRYALGVYTQIAYAGTGVIGGVSGWIGVAASTYDAFTNPTGNLAQDGFNAVTPTVTTAAQDHLDRFEQKYYNGRQGDLRQRNGRLRSPGKYNPSHFRGFKNSIMKPGLKAIGYVSLVQSLTDYGARQHEKLQELTYKFADILIKKSWVNANNEGLFHTIQEGATVEGLESGLNAIYTGLGMVLSGFDLSTEDGNKEAKAFLDNLENQKIIVHFINFLQEHQQQEKQNEDD